MVHHIRYSALAAASLAAFAVPAAAQTAPIIYQGVLEGPGGLLEGVYDLRFELFTNETGGVPLSTIPDLEDVEVNGGLINVPLPFPSSVFTGTTRFLEIGVRPGAETGAFETLTPRQAIGNAPQALFAPQSQTPPSPEEPEILSGIPDGFEGDYKLVTTAGTFTDLGFIDPIEVMFAPGPMATGLTVVAQIGRIFDGNPGFAELVSTSPFSQVDLSIGVTDGADTDSIDLLAGEIESYEVVFSDDGGAAELLTISFRTIAINRGLGGTPVGATDPSRPGDAGFTVDSPFVARPVLGTGAEVPNAFFVGSAAFTQVAGGFSNPAPARVRANFLTLPPELDVAFSRGDLLQIGGQLLPAGPVLFPVEERPVFGVRIIPTDDELFCVEFDIDLSE
ncbi:MAG: hypothetical protein AAGB51_10070 [Planctomycetota bacterium]